MAYNKQRTSTNWDNNQAYVIQGNSCMAITKQRNIKRTATVKQVECALINQWTEHIKHTTYSASIWTFIHLFVCSQS